MMSPLFRLEKPVEFIQQRIKKHLMNDWDSIQINISTWYNQPKRNEGTENPASHSSPQAGFVVITLEV